MKEYRVYLMTPYLTWEEVKAEGKNDAIVKCRESMLVDCEKPHIFIALEEER